MVPTTREMAVTEIDLMIRYFLDSDHDYLRGMGVDIDKLPTAAEWHKLLAADFDLPLVEKRFYYVIWELDGEPVGHSNINKIIFGQEAYMHLHLWRPLRRRAGLGTAFVIQSLTHYFTKFELQSLYCEPYALNPAPNRTLANVGFSHVQRYETTPGWINFHQEVNLWLLRRAAWEASNDI